MRTVYALPRHCGKEACTLEGVLQETVQSLDCLLGWMQAETIETIYMAAVEATENLKAGNVSLTKTVAVNRSTTRYLVVLLLVATLSLLLFDWLNS